MTFFKKMLKYLSDNPIRRVKMSRNSEVYMSIYLPKNKQDLPKRIRRIAKKKKKSVNQIMLDMIESYLKIFE